MRRSATVNGLEKLSRPERLLQKISIARQARRFASRYDDDIERGLFLPRIYGKRDTGHLAVEMNVRDQRAKFEPGGRQDQFSGFRRAALDHLQPFPLQDVGQDFALKAVVLDNKSREKRHRTSP